MSTLSPIASGMAQRLGAGTGRVARLWPGTGLCGLLALAATFVATLHGGPQLLYALLFGIALHHLHDEARSRPGIAFCASTLLRFGVGLLGARITAAQIAGLGWATAAVVVAGVATTIALALAAGRALGLSRAQATLAGGAVAICGASAALALSAVLPREKDGERFTLMVVVSVTVLSTLAMVAYPLVARMLDLSPALAGLFLGGTIHDVAQVVGAGYTLGPQAGDVATVVKLFRVAMLTVVVVVVSLAFGRSRELARAGRADTPADADAGDGRGGTHARQPLVPWFLWLFVAMVIVNSAGAMPPAAQQVLNDLSRACLVVAIAALGIRTSFRQLADAGWRPMLLIVVETLWLAGFALAWTTWIA